MCSILVEMWAAMASGPDIVDRHKAMLAGGAMPSTSAPAIPTPASAPAPDSADVDPNDIDPNDVDPNDVVPVANNAAASSSTGPRQYTMADYLDGAVDDDDDEEYAF
ncbi:hypothetical protein EWM64_g6964 [Hericium alpestre]|uniref:Uncharacterized protein n=1 Tax=Hericium alpestre TaxID=135208 RepID=A0A4Y9ZU70_9AGAM|nr:hypothetical protein EWM64_g6964 [Hericium alpestre]